MRLSEYEGREEEVNRRLTAASHVVVHPPSEPCAWRENKDDCWETACGGAFLFTVDGPAENGYNFCPCCGRPLEVSA